MKEPYSLIGIDGNAYYIMAYVRKAMIREKFSKEAIDNYTEKAKSGNYDNLVAVSFEQIEEVNEKLKQNEE